MYYVTTLHRFKCSRRKLLPQVSRHTLGILQWYARVSRQNLVLSKGGRVGRVSRLIKCAMWFSPEAKWERTTSEFRESLRARKRESYAAELQMKHTISLLEESLAVQKRYSDKEQAAAAKIETERQAADEEVRRLTDELNALQDKEKVTMTNASLELRVLTAKIEGLQSDKECLQHSLAEGGRRDESDNLAIRILRQRLESLEEACRLKEEETQEWRKSSEVEHAHVVRLLEAVEQGEEREQVHELQVRVLSARLEVVSSDLKEAKRRRKQEWREEEQQRVKNECENKLLTRATTRQSLGREIGMEDAPCVINRITPQWSKHHVVPREEDQGGRDELEVTADLCFTSPRMHSFPDSSSPHTWWDAERDVELKMLGVGHEVERRSPQEPLCVSSTSANLHAIPLAGEGGTHLDDVRDVARATRQRREKAWEQSEVAVLKDKLGWMLARRFATASLLGCFSRWRSCEKEDRRTALRQSVGEGGTTRREQAYKETEGEMRRQLQTLQQQLAKDRRELQEYVTHSISNAADYMQGLNVAGDDAPKGDSTDEVVEYYGCDFDCGFQDSYEAVLAHELTCQHSSCTPPQTTKLIDSVASHEPLMPRTTKVPEDEEIVGCTNPSADNLQIKELLAMIAFLEEERESTARWIFEREHDMKQHLSLAFDEQQRLRDLLAVEANKSTGGGDNVHELEACKLELVEMRQNYDVCREEFDEAIHVLDVDEIEIQEMNEALSTKGNEIIHLLQQVVSLKVELQQTESANKITMNSCMIKISSLERELATRELPAVLAEKDAAAREAVLVAEAGTSLTIAVTGVAGAATLTNIEPVTTESNTAVKTQGDRGVVTFEVATMTDVARMAPVLQHDTSQVAVPHDSRSGQLSESEPLVYAVSSDTVTEDGQQRRGENAAEMSVRMKLAAAEKELVSCTYELALTRECSKSLHDELEICKKELHERDLAFATREEQEKEKETERAAVKKEKETESEIIKQKDIQREGQGKVNNFREQDLKTQILAERLALRESVAAHTKMHDQLQAKQTEIDALEDTVLRLETEVQQRQTELESERGLSTRDETHAVNRVVELENDLTDARGDGQRMRERQSVLCEEVDALKANVIHWKHELQARDAQNNDMRSQQEIGTGTTNENAPSREKEGAVCKDQGLKLSAMEEQVSAMHADCVELQELLASSRERTFAKLKRMVLQIQVQPMIRTGGNTRVHTPEQVLVDSGLLVGEVEVMQHEVEALQMSIGECNAHRIASMLAITTAVQQLKAERETSAARVLELEVEQERERVMESEKLHKSEREVATLKALEGTGNEREYEREAERAQERDKTREAARLKEALLTRCTHLTEKLRQAESLARIRTVNKEAVENGIKAVIHDLEGVMEYAHVMGHRIFNTTQSATTPSALAPAVANTVSTTPMCAGRKSHKRACC